MTWPLLALSIPSMLTGYLGFNVGNLQAAISGAHSEHALPSQFGAFIYGPGGPRFEPVEPMMLLSSIVCAVLGFALAYMMYQTRTVHINKSFAEAHDGFKAMLYNISFNKWYIDDIYFGIVDRVFLPLFKSVWNFVDMFIVEGVVNGAGLVTLSFGEVLKYMQTGRGQYYALVVFGAVAGIAWLAYILPNH
jgi:NAD(P)H-quinone oxidoreductase subunit 5